MKKKVNKNLIKKYIIWFVVSVILISIAIYTGHEGGMEEKNTIYKFVKNLDQSEFNVLECGFINQINNPPQLVLIEKKKEY